MWAVSPDNKQKARSAAEHGTCSPYQMGCVLPAVAKVSPSRPRKAAVGFPANAVADQSDSPVNATIGHNGRPPLDAGDILIGVMAITAYLRELLQDPYFPESKTYNWLARGYIPGGKIGTLWRGAKSEIRRHLRAPTNLPDGGAR